jgi:hypothetical protein
MAVMRSGHRWLIDRQLGVTETDRPERNVSNGTKLQEIFGLTRRGTSFAGALKRTGSLQT